MYAVEFKAKVKDGMIEIPEKYRKKLLRNVKVILLTEDTTGEESFDIIEELLESPLKMPGFKPFKREEIYDRNK